MLLGLLPTPVTSCAHVIGQKLSECAPSSRVGVTSRVNRVRPAHVRLMPQKLRDGSGRVCGRLGENATNGQARATQQFKRGLRRAHVPFGSHIDELLSLYPLIFAGNSR